MSPAPPSGGVPESFSVKAPPKAKGSEPRPGSNFGVASGQQTPQQSLALRRRASQGTGLQRHSRLIPREPTRLDVPPSFTLPVTNLPPRDSNAWNTRPTVLSAPTGQGLVRGQRPALHVWRRRRKGPRREVGPAAWGLCNLGQSRQRRTGTPGNLSVN